MISSVKASPWHYFFDGIRKQNLQKNIKRYQEKGGTLFM